MGKGRGINLFGFQGSPNVLVVDLPRATLKNFTAEPIPLRNTPTLGDKLKPLRREKTKSEQQVVIKRLRVHRPEETAIEQQLFRTFPAKDHV